MKIDIVPRILDFDQFRENLLTAEFHPHFEIQQHAVVDLRRTQPVNARNRRHDDDVIPFQQRPGGRVAHLIDGIVDRRILRDIGIRLGKVGFGLIVVVIADEIFDRVLREKLFELLIELSRQGLIVDQHERRLLNLLDQVRHRKGLAGSRDSEEDLMFFPRTNPRRQPGDRIRLMATGLKGSFELERRHGNLRRSSYQRVRIRSTNAESGE